MIFAQVKLWLYGAGAALVAFAAAWLYRAGGNAKENEANKDKVETHDRINNAETVDVADSARDWLRDRK